MEKLIIIYYTGLDQDGDEPTLAADGKPFTTLVYGNGDGYQKGGEGYDSIAQFIAPQTRANLTGVDLGKNWEQNMVQSSSEK